MNRIPLTYLISNGSTKSNDFTHLLGLTEAAVKARITYLQIREKHLSTRALFDLTLRVMRITRSSATKVLVNDRLDVALAAGADGVHLSGISLSAGAICGRFGGRLVIGVSTHSVVEAVRARDEGADFAVIGPIFSTPGKLIYGPPLRREVLRAAAIAARPLPLFALGGVDAHNFPECLTAGAVGIAGIRIFGDSETLSETVAAIRSVSIPGPSNDE